MSNYDPYYSHSAAEGVTSEIIEEIKRLIKDSLPTYSRMIVMEVISDPQIITEDKIDYWTNILKVSNIKFANILPRNTIIAQKILSGVTYITPPMFMFPFFPSHLALPCKPGEMVWTMFEDPNARIKDIGYWLCRITEPHFVDDVNHTHHARQLDHSFNSTIKKKVEGNDKPVYELRNGKVNKSKDGTRFVVNRTNVISSKEEDVFERLLIDTDASRMMQYESVPRFKKRPGDVAIEGSNNSLIVLGTDRTSAIADFDEFNGKNGGNFPRRVEDDLIGYAGSIDIVAGRGATKETGGTAVQTKRIVDGQELKKELGKFGTELVENEGDVDLKNDRSRILVSQRTRPDTNFGISDYIRANNKIEESTDGDSAVVIKSDKVRIIARSDITFMVTDFVYNQEQGKPSYKVELEESAYWASITIRRNGDIIFTPSSLGVIKLGGDDADKAILCTSKPSTVEFGDVRALPIATTGGGFVGTANGNVDSEAVSLNRAPDLGTLSKKVLIK